MAMETSKPNLSDVSPTSVLFVCMGNICRSPMAQAIFADLVKKRGINGKFTVDSAGLGDWKLDEPPDPRAQRVLAEHQLHLDHRARMVRPVDFADFDLILYMEPSHLDKLKEICPIPLLHQKLHSIREVDPQGPGTVPDPFARGRTDDFRQMYEVLERCCKAWLETLLATKPTETRQTL